MTVVWPQRNDPRMRLFVVITAIQVLGQTVIGFKLSIAQVLVTIAACGLIELVVVFTRERQIAWPASALQTGNSIALLLRTTGTSHGDWWSLNGIEWFLLAAVIAMGSKFLVRVGGRHRFNPSNIGIVLTLLLVGIGGVFPQYLWWGHPGPATFPGLEQGAVWLVIGTGAWWVLRPLRMAAMLIAFSVPFVVMIGLLATTGHCFVATWHPGPVCGQEYWAAICLSPELAIFVFFMMSDPKTMPAGATARALYGATVAVLSASMISFQVTEFGVKLGLLAGLTVACCFTPVMDWLARPRRAPLRPTSWLRRADMLASPALVATAVLAFTVPTSVASLAANPQLNAVERGEASVGPSAQ